MQADTLANDGFVPINVSTVEIGGQTLWTGLFEQLSVTDWTVETVPAADYQDTFDTNVDAGRIPIYVHGLSIGGSPFLTGIWVNPIGPATEAVHGLDSDVLTPLPGTKYQHGELVDSNAVTTQIVGYGPVSVMVEDNLSGVYSVVFSVNNVPVPGSEVDYDAATHTWSFEFRPHLKGKHLYQITIVATDIAGNSASETFQVEGVRTNKKN